LHDDVVRLKPDSTLVGLDPDSTLDPGAMETGAPVPAWEQIEAGRFMPRRIRGSYRGRELG
jgi:hypothetical protein